MSNQEREIKFYIQNLKAAEQRLQASGALLTRPRVFEINLRFDTSDYKLFKTGRLLRLRQDDRVHVTFKSNAHVEGGVIVRTELEYTVDDFITARKLFEALGYQVMVTYEKYRQVYQLGEVEVDLDELPFGNFIEIEGPSNEQIEDAAHKLGLDWSKGIATNYLGLFEIVRIQKGFTFNDLTFENFRNLTIQPEDMGVSPADG
jgi:adenylate cyclase class 2